MARVEGEHSGKMMRREDYHEELRPNEYGVFGVVTTKRTREGIQIVSSNMKPQTKINNTPVNINR